MYVRMCVCRCVCRYVGMYVGVYVGRYVCVYVDMYVRMCVCMYVCNMGEIKLIRLFKSGAVLADISPRPTLHKQTCGEHRARYY